MTGRKKMLLKPLLAKPVQWMIKKIQRQAKKTF